MLAVASVLAVASEITLLSTVLAAAFKESSVCFFYALHAFRGLDVRELRVRRGEVRVALLLRLEAVLLRWRLPHGD